jgi:hypothetical protein
MQRKVLPMMDTTAEALAVQVDVLRRMTGPQRFMVAVEMSMAMRELAAARLHAEHPDWSDLEIQRQLLRYAFAGGDLPEVLR